MPTVSALSSSSSPSIESSFLPLSSTPTATPASLVGTPPTTPTQQAPTTSIAASRTNNTASAALSPSIRTPSQSLDSLGNLSDFQLPATTLAADSGIEMQPKGTKKKAVQWKVSPELATRNLYTKMSESSSEGSRDGDINDDPPLEVVGGGKNSGKSSPAINRKSNENRDEESGALSLLIGVVAIVVAKIFFSFLMPSYTVLSTLLSFATPIGIVVWIKRDELPEFFD